MLKQKGVKETDIKLGFGVQCCIRQHLCLQIDKVPNRSQIKLMKYQVTVLMNLLSSHS